ncbi:Ig-like domain-containing protein [Exiguobacterium sp. s22]|uniref:Ig-like domain-containing protein n=1 Tax=Exiguobacterium sp. s22 TaxID=2751272 RepID=UPI001BE795D8|nr:Ig-like domain-containing protein [Exiguobacterium sp. s22]
MKRIVFVCLLLIWVQGAMAIKPIAAESTTHELVFGEVLEGELVKGEANQTFEVTLPQNGKLTLDLTLEMANTLVTVVDENNRSVVYEWVRGSQYSPARYQKTLDLNQGTYRLQFSYALGKYAILTDFDPVTTDDIEPNDGTLLAQPLPLQKTITGHLTLQDRSDVYRIELKQAGRLQLELTSFVLQQAYFELIDEMNTSIYQKSVSGSMNNPGKQKMVVDLEPGIYYLNVYDLTYRSNTGVYEISSSFKLAKNQEREPNNGSVEAESFPFYTSRTGLISWNDSIDVYKLSLPKESRVRVELLSFIDRAASLTVKNAQGEKVLSTYLYSSSIEPGRYDESVVLPKGDYFVYVQGGMGTSHTGTYQLKVSSSHLLPALSVNRISVRSTKVSGKTEKRATVTMTIGKKSYKRTADAKGNYSFSINKQKVGTPIKVTSKNKYGSTVKAVKVSR